MSLTKKASVAGLGVALAALLVAGSAHAASFPGYGADAPPISPANGPGWIITLNPGGTGTLTQVAGQSPTYDGGAFNVGDDTYIGVINNSGHSVSTLALNGGTNPIFGFDGDGIDTFGSPGTDPTGYGGPDGLFSNIVGNTGDITFTNGIANGATDYFSLESTLVGATFTVSVAPGPVPGAGYLGFFALALGAAALKLRERFAR